MSVESSTSKPEAGTSDTVQVQLDASLERPSPRICIVWLASRATLWALVISGLAIARSFGLLDGQWWQIWVFNPSLAWLICPTHILLPLLAYRGLGYQLREHDLLVRHGILTREYVAVPLARIQQVDASANPFERWLELTTLVVHTAGTRSARTRIPGLRSARAIALRDKLSRKGDELAD